MQVLSVSSLKGGVGKTSVTLGLASSALSQGIRTLVVDLDPHADASTALGVQLSGAADIGSALKSPRRVPITKCITPSGWDKEGSLDVAVGSAFSGIYDRPDLGKRDLKRLVNILEPLRDYDLVLIDCPPSLNGLTRMAWLASDGVVLVTEPGLFSVAGTERTLRAISVFNHEYAPDLAPAGVVVNRVREESKEHKYRINEMQSMFGQKVLTPHLPEQANWQQIQGAAQPIHRWPEESSREIGKKFDELLRKLRANASK